MSLFLTILDVLWSNALKLWSCGIHPTFPSKCRMGQAVSGDPSSAGYTFNKNSGAEDEDFQMRMDLCSCPTCELQGNDSPGFGMRECRGFAHPVLLLFPPQQHGYKTLQVILTISCPCTFSAHTSSFPPHPAAQVLQPLLWNLSLLGCATQSSQDGFAG